MSGLTDTLRDRASRRGRTARVSCGALGTVTVEALSPADCALLARQGDRALLYAACRELQESGEALRREGLLYRPDEIMGYVTEEEAAGAVRTVLALSGLGALEKQEAAGTEIPEVRLGSVQRKWPEEENPPEGRLEFVRDSGKEIPKIRLVPVQSASPSSLPFPLVLVRMEPAGEENGQASCEFLARLEPLREESGLLPAEQNLPEGEPAAVQDIAVLPDILKLKPAGGPEPEEAEHENESESEAGPEEAVHEMESEPEAGPEEAEHENKSESEAGPEEAAHEMESEPEAGPEEAVHEMESEPEAGPEEAVHEMESEPEAGPEEAAHEMESEPEAGPEEAVHEMKSEFVVTAEPPDAEAFAWALLEGLRRAAGARYSQHS